MADRIFVVGHSAVTCLGRDMDSTWQGLIDCRSGIRRQPALGAEMYLQDLGGVVENFGPGSAWEDRDIAKLPARFLHLAMAAARSAWSDAGLDRREGSIDRDRAAIVVGSAFGGLDLLAAEEGGAARRRSLALSPYLIPGMIINQAAGQIAQHMRLFGPSAAPANACASGGHAIVLGAMFLRAGDADLALCGAGESAFTPSVVNGFATMKRSLGASREIGQSTTQARPAVRSARTERASCSRKGRAPSFWRRKRLFVAWDWNLRLELLGWSTNSDGHHLAMPCRDRIVRCLEAAMRKAGVAAGDIDYYNAHGTSTMVNDHAETLVIKDVFGDKAGRLAISSIKGALGHSLARPRRSKRLSRCALCESS